MLDTAFFLTMGGAGVALVGFAAVFAALHQVEGPDAAVHQWRMSAIVTAAFRLALLGLGTLVLHGLTDNLESTARIISGIAVIAVVVQTITGTRPGPAWSNEFERRFEIAIAVVFSAVIAGNVIIGSQNYLRLVMLILLLEPAMIFIRATIDASAEAALSEEADE